MLVIVISMLGYAEVSEAPSMELLEFLAEFNDVEFADLVKFTDSNGNFIPFPNSDRNRYLLDLYKELIRALDEKFQK